VTGEDPSPAIKETQGGPVQNLIITTFITMKTNQFLASLALAATALASTANAGIISVSGSVGGAPTGMKYVNFDNLSNGATGNLVGTGPNGSIALTITPNARVATGAVSGQYARPYISGSNGAGFASQNTAGPDNTPYLTSGRVADGGSIKMDFGSNQQYLGLLWGSVDGYNKLSFYDASNALVGEVTGSDVVASPNGNQGQNGTLYVNIISTPFRYVVASSTSFAFEFDNVAYNASPTGVPDSGASLGWLGLALVGLGSVRRFLV
jgi:hypothetical protein